MGTGLHSTVLNSGKQRRRTVVSTDHRGLIRGANFSKKVLPTPATLSKKSRRVLIFRGFAVGTSVLVLLSTLVLWTGRARHSIDLTESPDSLKISRVSLNNQGFKHVEKATPKDVVLDNEFPEEEHLDHSKINDGTLESDREKQKHEESLRESRMKAGRQTSPPTNSKGVHPTLQTKKIDMTAKQHHKNDLPSEQIEWYTRGDFKNGRRPLCRITRPVILSNGTVLLPRWMKGSEMMLQKCGLGRHGFYDSLQSVGIDKVIDINADFALTIHLERFQEPTHVSSVYLTEHVLKSSFLFDTFNGAARQKDGVEVNHCIATETDTKCGLSHPEKNLLRPSIFVPRRIERSPESNWPRRFVNMFGRAHSNRDRLIHLNTSSILMRSHAKRSYKLIGTRFRSMMTADAMFRHLPVGAMVHSSFFSSQNSINREHRTRNKDGKCKLTIGVSASTDASSEFDDSADLKEKIELLLKFAQLSQVEVKEVEGPVATSFEEHTKQLQDLDVFVAGSGDDLTSIGFLPPNSAVVELMPFGIKPLTHRSLARALNLTYHAVRGKPHDSSFKQCIMSEISTLRKKGKLKLNETPQWEEPLMKAWNNAVGEFVMSGSSEFDVLTSEEPIKNYFSKHCAMKQKIEIGVDEAARQIITLAKELCTASQQQYT